MRPVRYLLVRTTPKIHLVRYFANIPNGNLATRMLDCVINNLAADLLLDVVASPFLRGKKYRLACLHALVRFGILLFP